MTQPRKNPFIDLFASVQLALMLLFLLAATSIIGTLIPQGQPIAFYVKEYGLRSARFMQLLDLQDMYNSWWFLGLLALFALNLVVCSLERIPLVVRIVRRDGLAAGSEQIKKLPLRREVDLAVSVEESSRRVAALLSGGGFRPRQAERDSGLLFFAQKGAWTRFGVYVVHLSILVILAGAVVGSSTVARTLLRSPGFAFKGSIMLPEGESTDHILAFKSGERIDLGFALQCELFTIEHYPNGMPKTYRSKVTVLDHGKPVQTTDIEVNQPLTYKGVTFYQSSYQPFPNYILSLKKQGSDMAVSERIAPAQEKKWAQAGVSYGIINRETQGEVTRRLKIWFSDGQGDPSVFWVSIGQEATVQRPTGNYILNIRQLYATGLQATKDPGVGLVYLGCLMMLVGLYIAFFLSHRRIYAWVQPQGQGSRILFAGDANKNRVGFEAKFSELISGLEQ